MSPVAALAVGQRRPPSSLPSLRPWNRCRQSSVRPRQGPSRAPAHQELAALADGDRVECCYAVRDRSRRPTKRGGEWLSLKIADRTATIQAKSWDEVEARFAVAEPGTVVHVVGRFECSRQWGDALIVESIAPAGEGDYDPANLLEVSPLPLERMEADLADLLETIQDPDLRELLDRLLRAGRRALGALPRRPGRQALPPGLPPRAARAHALGRPGRQRRRVVLPGHRPRRRDHRRAAARHRQARGLQRQPARDRPDRPRPADGRDPARLLPGPPRDRVDRGLRPRPRLGGPPHHPLPPRHARARLAGRPRRPARRPSST